MSKHSKKLIVIIIALGIAAIFSIFNNRVALRDFYQNLTKPDVPEAVTYEEASNGFADEGIITEDEEETTNELVETLENIRDALKGEEEEEENEKPTPTPLQEENDNSEEGVESGTTGQGEGSEEVENSLPAEINLAVPFTSQAPHSNWELPYQEACEEAAVLMVDAYFSGYTLPADVADEKLLELVAWQEENLGFYKDTTAAETSQFIKGLYGYKRVDVIANPTADQIKGFIAIGLPVIVPAAGQQLGNPNFTSPGPLYHMYVIKGYTSKYFITNDPGTRNGADYLYTIDKVMGTMHDWNGGDVVNGTPVIIVIYPN